MKLKYKFHMVELGGKISGVAVGKDAANYHGVLNLNETSRELMNLLAQDTTEEAVTDAMCAEYPAEPRAVIAEAVHEFVEQLRENGLIEE